MLNHLCREEEDDVPREQAQLLLKSALCVSENGCDIITRDITQEISQLRRELGQECLDQGLSAQDFPRRCCHSDPLFSQSLMPPPALLKN